MNREALDSAKEQFEKLHTGLISKLNNIVKEKL